MYMSVMSLYVQFNAFNNSMFTRERIFVTEPYFKIILHGVGKLSEEPRHIRVGTAVIIGVMAAISIPQHI